MFVGLFASASFAQSNSCIAFENGTGNYGDNCYSSGLQDMKEGACYTMNPARASENPKWINNIASQEWWWVETSCGEEVVVESSSSEEEVVAESSSSEEEVVVESSSSEEEVVESSSSEEEIVVASKCIDFENGTGNYGDNCYKSGLQDMKEGACYTMNPARASENPKWINNIASQEWWWVETSCEDEIVVESSSSEEEVVVESSSSEEEVVVESSSSEEEVVVESSSSEEEVIESSSSEEEVIESSSSEEEIVVASKCIDFENGTGNYGDNCYKSGLQDMKEGVCYTMNPARASENPKWINNIASQEWWWVETSCEDEEVVESSSSEEEVVAESSSSEEEEVAESSSSEEEVVAEADSEEESGSCPEGAESCIRDRGEIDSGDNNSGSILVQEGQDHSGLIIIQPRGKFVGGVNGTAGMASSAELKSSISFTGRTLNVVASSNGNKIMRVFSMNGQLLGSESFSGSSVSFDMSKYAGKGVLVVRVSEGRKVLATKQVSVR